MVKNEWIILILAVVSSTKPMGSIICLIQKRSMGSKKPFAQAVMSFIKNMRRK